MHRALWEHTPTDTHGKAFCACISLSVSPTPPSRLLAKRPLRHQRGFFRQPELRTSQIDFESSGIQLQPGQTAQTVKYSVVGHPFDQGPPETDHGVGGSASVRRIVTDLPSRTTQKHDILYVKCSPPSANGNSQCQWNGAMRAAVASLGKMYNARAMYFILGVGMEWMTFYWDPDSPAPAGQALKMAAGEVEGEGDGAEGWYEISPEVRSPPGIDARHIDAEDVVHTDRARSLDCFTVAPLREAGEVPRLAFQADLDFLEEFLGVVERYADAGEDEPNSE